jgi:acyl-CoA thioesterase-2
MVDALLDVLNLERIELDIFRGLSVDGSPPRVFGGQVAAQSLIAAARTLPREDNRPPHSFHSYFIRPGDPHVPVVFQVDRIRDGRSFSVRRVLAVQNGKGIFALTASFQSPSRGVEHGAAAPDVPPPDQCPPLVFEPHHPADDEDGSTPHFLSAFEMRMVSSSRRSRDAAVDEATGQPQLYDATWLRTAGTLPPDPLVHTAMVVFASDHGIVDGALSRHRLDRSEHMRQASLDHVMWFHHPVRADDWLLYRRVSPAASGGRALGIGEIFDAAGAHRITVAQEAMVRLPQYRG